MLYVNEYLSGTLFYFLNRRGKQIFTKAGNERTTTGALPIFISNKIELDNLFRLYNQSYKTISNSQRDHERILLISLLKVNVDSQSDSHD